MLSSTTICLPSVRWTVTSSSRMDLPVLQHLGELGARQLLALAAEEPALRRELVVGLARLRRAAPQLHGALLYCRIRPAASQTQVAIGSSSRISSEARSACSSDSENTDLRR